jgi:UMF1 family MFS transporter
MHMNRRSLFAASAGLLAAPAIARAQTPHHGRQVPSDQMRALRGATPQGLTDAQLQQRIVTSPAPAGAPAHRLFTDTFRQLKTTIGQAAKFRDLAVLLGASLLYGTGMTVIVMFASILAAEFGFNDVQLVLFVAVITVSGVIGTLIPAFFQDRFGHKRMTVVLLSVWIFAALGFALFSWLRTQSADPAAYPRWPLWVVGNFIGFGLGSLGAANRAFFCYLTPASRSAEFFGLWGLVFKFAAVLTIPFGLAKDFLGTTAALLVLAGFLVAGLVVTCFIDERRGLAAAQAADAPATTS